MENEVTSVAQANHAVSSENTPSTGESVFVGGSASNPIVLDGSGETVQANGSAVDVELEAERCRLDKGLFALLYHELTAARLSSTAKRLLKEAGVQSVELSGGVPPRLKDLVDVWNEKQAQGIPLKRSVLPSLKPTGSNATAATTAGAAAAGVSTGKSVSGNVAGKQKDSVANKPKSSVTYVRPYPGNKPTSVREQEKLMTGKGTRGPWLQEEEQRLKDAVELYGDSNLEVIDAFVKTRSLKGIAKHLMRTKKAWGLENNRKMFEALLSDTPPPSMEEFMKVKMEDKSEKDVITWLEWFIIHNNNHHPQEHVALAAKEKADIAKAEKERLEREKMAAAHQYALAQASLAATATSTSSSSAAAPVTVSSGKSMQSAQGSSSNGVTSASLTGKTATSSSSSVAPVNDVNKTATSSHPSSAKPTHVTTEEVTDSSTLADEPPDLAPSTPADTQAPADDGDVSAESTTVADSSTQASAGQSAVSPIQQSTSVVTAAEGGGEERRKGTSPTQAKAARGSGGKAGQKNSEKRGSAEKKDQAQSQSPVQVQPPPKRPRLRSVEWTQMEEELLKRYYKQFKGDLRRITKRLPTKTQEDVEEHIEEMMSMGALQVIPAKQGYAT